MKSTRFTYLDRRFTRDNGISFQKTISIQNPDVSVDWNEKQNASLDEYKQTHEYGEYPEHVQRWFKIFKASIAEQCLQVLNTKPAVRILDIGCGTSPHLPVYIPNSKNIEYIGLDPILTNETRDYPYICCRLEDLQSLLEPTEFDIFIFSTSLDHFEDLSMLRSLILPFASENARCILLSGLHDTNIMASWMAFSLAQQLLNIPYKKNIVCRLRYRRRLRKLLKQMQAQYPMLSTRQAKLEAGLPLDELHFHYFELGKYQNLLESVIGPVTEEIILSPENAIINITSLAPTRKNASTLDRNAEL